MNNIILAPQTRPASIFGGCVQGVSGCVTIRWPGWRNGRRKGLKIPREKSHVGSIPTPGIVE